MPKKKKKDHDSASPRISDNTLRIEGDAMNTALVIGDNNRVVQKASQPKPVEVMPYEGNKWLLVSLGRWIMRTLFHGNMERSLKPYSLGLSALTVIELYFTFGRIYLEPSFIASLADSMINLWIEVVWIFALVITTSLGWGVILISGETTCPECHQKFMFTRKERLLTGQAIHRGMEVTNYKTTYSCDNCGYSEKNVPEVVERELPASDE